MDSIDMQQLGRRIRSERVLRGWTQEDLATRASLTQASIARIELGRNPGLRVDSLFAIASALQVSADYLMGLDSEPKAA